MLRINYKTLIIKKYRDNNLNELTKKINSINKNINQINKSFYEFKKMHGTDKTDCPSLEDKISKIY